MKYCKLLLVKDPESQLHRKAFIKENGIVMLLRLEQSTNADAPSEVTESGIVMLSRLEQPLNADAPIEVTEFGSTMLLSL